MNESTDVNRHIAPPDDISKMIAEFIEHRDNKRYVEAAIVGDALVRAAPDIASAWFDYGRVLRNLKLLDKAIACFRNAAAIDQEMIVATLFLGHTILEHCNWHQTWKQAGFWREPWSTKDFCNDFSPEMLAHSQFIIAELYNLGLDLAAVGYYEESAICHQTVTKHCPDIIHAHYGLASMLLAMRRYPLATQTLREWNERSRKNFNIPFWYGDDIPDKTLYLFADHGLGDVMQFIRYVPIAAARCRKTILYIPRSLWRVFGNIPNVEIVSEINQPFDAMCSLFMLPHVIGIDETTIGDMVPYLHAEPALIDHWKQRLPPGDFRIGIAWQGNPKSELDQGRSIPLACYAPLARVPGVRLISLQLNFGLDQLDALPDGMSVTTLGPDFNAGSDNVVDTAAVMKSLDLIISSDTSVPHIAGALGCPVWTLLKAAPDWRWQRQREDCPWYPTMRLFRQTTAGRWDDVIARVVDAVIERMSTPSTHAG